MFVAFQLIISDFCISHGSVATVLKRGGQNYSHLREVLSWCRTSKIIKIDQCFSRLFQKIKVARFYGPRCITTSGDTL